MKALLGLAARSAWNRRCTLALVVLSIALSTLLLLSVERMRTDVRESFSQSVSGTDLIVGARTGSVQLMLYAVFRVGGATNNMRMSSVQAIAAHRAVDWVVPLSLGDSHRGFPGARHDAGVLHALPLRRPRSRCVLRAGPRLRRHARRPVRSRDRRRGGAAHSATSSASTSRSATAAACVQPCGRARRQAVHRRRHPRAHRHAGGPHRAHQPGGDRGDPSRLGRRRADAGPEDRARAGAQVRPRAQAGDGRAGRAEEPRRRVRGAARGRRLTATSR